MACARLVVLAILAVSATAGAGTLTGRIVDQDTSDAVPGATIVATRTDVATPMTTEISDEAGAYTLVVEPGTYQLTIYFDGAEIVRPGFVVDDGVTTVPDVAVVATTVGETIFIEGTPYSYVQNIPVGRTFTDPEPLPEPDLYWRRDHLGALALEPRMQAARTTTTADRAYRLPGSPAIALELLDRDGTDATWGGFAIAQPGASGGAIDVRTVRGKNQGAAAGRLDLGRAGRFAATGGASMIDDHAWASTGLVLEQRGDGLHSQFLTSLNYSIGDNFDLDASGMIIAGPDDREDGWGQVTAVMRSDDDDRILEIGVVGQDLETGTAPGAARTLAGLTEPAAVDRTGGRMVLQRKDVRWRGEHDLTIGGEIGGGGADSLRHTDVRAFAGDAWQVKPHITVNAGVRWDRRTLGTAFAEVWSPRVMLMWDPTKEGRSLWFLNVERVAHLDEGFLGAWRSGDVAHDDVSAGVRRSWGDHVRWSAAVRTRTPATADRIGQGIEAGADLDARYESAEKRLVVAATLSTLEEAATLIAGWSCGCERDRLEVGAIARATPDDVAWGATLGFRYKRAYGTNLAVELMDVDDPADRSAHLVLAASW